MLCVNNNQMYRYIDKKKTLKHLRGKFINDKQLLMSCCLSPNNYLRGGVNISILG